jgi:hypothetical protein
MKQELEKLEIYKIIVQNIQYDSYNSNVIRKLLKFQY